MAKVRLSTRQKVVYILHMCRGQWLSVSDIRKRFHDRYQTNIKIDTIVNAIDENNFLNDNIRESTERRHQARQPVKVFQIPIDV